MRLLSRRAIPSVLLAVASLSSAQTWTRVTPATTPTGLGAMLLLTDGSVLVHNDGAYPTTWYRLRPDAFGSYVNGTWSQAASFPAGYGPLYFGSSVIPDGRVLVMGGEYNFGKDAFSNLGAIYDPVADQWTNVDPPLGWNKIGDAQQVVLADGRVMQASCCDAPSYRLAFFDPPTLTWTSADTSNTKFDSYDEEGFTLLPSGEVLSVDAYVGKGPTGLGTELFDPASGTWSKAADTPVQTWNVPGHELGPAVLRPDGTVFQAGAAPVTAIYDSKTGTWTQGPNFPDGLDIADGPAALETNGKVLMMASPGEFQKPSTFLEFDGANLVPVVGPPRAGVDTSYHGHMLELPTGQILFTDVSNDVEVFTPDGAPDPAWAPKPVLASTSMARGTTYTLRGFRFAGMSQGAAYGDDYQSATNYALVRLTNAGSGHVVYARTHNPSSYAVQSASLQSTQVDIPAGMETGLTTLEVVTNGIASPPVEITVR